MEENQNVQNENLTDDDLYAKLQTEKLLKQKKHKRIATLCGMCVAFAIALVIIVLAVVPVSLKPNFIDAGFDMISFYPGTINPDSTVINKGDEKYSDFVKALNDSFSQSYISALFSGSLSSYTISETKEDPSSIHGSSGGTLVSNKDYFVVLHFNEEQTLTKQDGKTYVSTSSSSKWDGKLTFTNVYVVVNKTDGLKSTKVYVVANYPKFDTNGEITENKKQQIVTISVKANTYEIYKAWNDLLK